MSDDLVTYDERLQAPWQTADPFLFCQHHDDRYPSGNEKMGPAASLEGRDLGADFSGKDGWSMYHGEEVPGFPRHPHRGFETVTLVREGFVDHADSLGARARFGRGDVQWMTAGNGIVHSEMFPLLDREEGNHTELFQLWLNLPREAKKKEPYFTMFWSEELPRLEVGEGDASMEVTVIAGRLEGAEPLEPPPTSWASREGSQVAIWVVTMEPGARWEIPPAGAEANRSLYFHEGGSCEIGGRRVESGRVIGVPADRACQLRNGDEPGELVVLQGRPIGEPVVQQGPFVMNTRGGIREAMLDYQRDQFGGWPWEQPDPVHERDTGRFALHGDGTLERP